MIKLDKNYTVDVDSTHGFTLKYESDLHNKEVNTKEGKKIKKVTTKETWYYPKLSMVLQKYYTVNLTAQNQKELLEAVIKVENNIKEFSKTFAKKGKIFEL